MTENLKEAVEKAQPGDVVLFSGVAGFSNVIKLMTSSNVSHVGIVAREGGKILMAESTTEIDVPNYDGKEPIRGVQIHDLVPRIEGYDGIVSLLPLLVPLTAEEEKRMNDWIWRVYSDRVPYDSVQIVDAGFDVFDKYGVQAEPDSSALFCSEFVMLALQHAGVMGWKINFSEVVPDDFLNYACFKKAVSLKTFS